MVTCSVVCRASIGGFHNQLRLVGMNGNHYKLSCREKILGSIFPTMPEVMQFLESGPVRDLSDISRGEGVGKPKGVTFF